MCIAQSLRQGGYAHENIPANCNRQVNLLVVIVAIGESYPDHADPKISYKNIQYSIPPSKIVPSDQNVLAIAIYPVRHSLRTSAPQPEYVQVRTHIGPERRVGISISSTVGRTISNSAIWLYWLIRGWLMSKQIPLGRWYERWGSAWGKILWGRR